MKTIGIKLADGSFYPVLEEDTPAEKVLELTTAHNNQTKIMVDLYRSKNCTMEDAEYVDSLQIENLNAHPNGEPTISFCVSIDEDNQLAARIKDPETGKESDTNITLVSRTVEERLVTDEYNISDSGVFDMNEINGTEKDEDSKADVGVAAAAVAGVGLLGAAAALNKADEKKSEEDELPNLDDIDLSNDISTEDSTAVDDEMVNAADTIDFGDNSFEDNNIVEPDQEINLAPESNEDSEAAIESFDIPEEIENKTDESEENVSDFSIDENSLEDASEETPVDETPAEENTDDLNFDMPDLETSNFEDASIETDSDETVTEETLSDKPLVDFSDELPNFDEPIAEPANEETSSDDTIIEDSFDDLSIPDEDFSEDIPDFNITDDELESNTDVSDDTSVNFEDSIPDFDDTETNEVPEMPDDFFNDNSLDNFDTSSDQDNTSPAAAGNLSFTGLYDKETEMGVSGSQDDEIKKKTKVPVIICVICAIICIIATVLILFVIPSKYNLINKSEKEVVVVQQAEKTDDIIELEPEPVPEAKEDEVVIVEKAEEVIPEQPEVVEEKLENISYKITWGDTLWDIADTYYKNPWRYKYIARYNGIKNPDHIVSGTYITIPAE